MTDIKAERFKRVAEPRVQKVLDSVENLAKCSNRRNYDYSEEDVRKMLSVIRGRLKKLEMLFGGEVDSRNESFHF